MNLINVDEYVSMLEKELEQWDKTGYPQYARGYKMGIIFCLGQVAKMSYFDTKLKSYNYKELKKMRNAMDISGTTLAEMLGIKASTLYKWENGQCEPSASMYLEILKIFKNFQETGRVEDVNGEGAEA